jgi:hypothetical protein
MVELDAAIMTINTEISVLKTPYIHRVFQNHIYIRCIHGILGRETNKYTVIHNVYTRFWPILRIYVVNMSMYGIGQPEP